LTNDKKKGEEGKRWPIDFAQREEGKRAKSSATLFSFSLRGGEGGKRKGKGEVNSSGEFAGGKRGESVHTLSSRREKRGKGRSSAGADEEKGKPGPSDVFYSCWSFKKKRKRGGKEGKKLPDNLLSNRGRGGGKGGGGGKVRGGVTIFKHHLSLAEKGKREEKPPCW